MATYDLDVLGEVSGAWEAVDAMLEVLRLWLPVAVVQVNADGYREADGVMVVPMSYGRVPITVLEQNEDQMPAVTVASTGTTGNPIISGMDDYSATYVVNVGVVDRADDWNVTGPRLQLWAALVRQVVLANRTLRGRVQKVRWTGETFGLIPADQGRTFAGAIITFQITLPVTAAGDVGGLTPDPVYPDPSGGLPNPLPDTPVVVAFEEDYEHGPAS